MHEADRPVVAAIRWLDGERELINEAVRLLILYPMDRVGAGPAEEVLAVGGAKGRMEMIVLEQYRAAG